MQTNGAEPAVISRKVLVMLLALLSVLPVADSRQTLTNGVKTLVGGVFDGVISCIGLVSSTLSLHPPRSVFT